MGTRRFGWLSLVVTCGACAVFSSNAWGAYKYFPERSFGPQGVGTSTFSREGGIAVDESSGDVYVYDDRAQRLYKFTGAGEPAEFTAIKAAAIEGVGSGGFGRNEIAVDNSGGPAKGDIYLANGSDVAVYSASGTEIGELNGAVETEVPGAPWGEPCGVAVDTQGDVFVGLNENHVSEYVPTGNPVKNRDYDSALNGLSGVCNIAVDSHDDVFTTALQEFGVSRYVSKYDASQFGAPQASGTQLAARGSSLAVNLSTDEVFIDDLYTLTRYDTTGNILQVVGQLASENRSIGVAVNSVSGDVYAARRDPNQIQVFSRVTPSAPIVTSSEPNAVSVDRRTASLEGTVNPSGEPTTYEFVYVSDGEYNPSAADPYTNAVTSVTDLLEAGIRDQQVKVDVSGLMPGTTYHYALRASNPLGTVTGPDHTFTTEPPLLPAVSEVSITGLAPGSATISALIGSHGLQTTYEIDLGVDGTYGTQTTGELVGASQVVSLTLLYLKPDTTYHYRILASTEDGSASSGDRTFTTPAYPILLPQVLPQIAVPAIAFPGEEKVNKVKPKNKATKRSKKHRKHKNKHKKKK